MKKFMWTLRRRSKNRHLRGTKQKGTGLLQKKGEWLKLPLTWYFKQEARWPKKSQRTTRRLYFDSDDQTLAPRKNVEITRCFQDRLVELEVAPRSWKIGKLVFCRADIGDVEVVRDLHNSSTGQRTRTRMVEPITRGGIDGISCEHLQVPLTQLVQKHWEWQEYRRKVVWHCSEVRPTMYFASVDINTACNVARPKRIAKHMEGGRRGTRWITAALLCELTGLERTSSRQRRGLFDREKSAQVRKMKDIRGNDGDHASAPRNLPLGVLTRRAEST